MWLLDELDDRVDVLSRRYLRIALVPPPRQRIPLFVMSFPVIASALVLALALAGRAADIQFVIWAWAL
jgi:hypothetical protein